MRRFLSLLAVVMLGFSVFAEPVKAAFPVQVASASTLNLCANVAGAPYLEVTGTTTITSFGTCSQYPQGRDLVVRFTGALTITYNSTSMITPNGVDLNVLAGDVLRVLNLGSGNWRVIDVHYGIRNRSGRRYEIFSFCRSFDLDLQRH